MGRLNNVSIMVDSATCTGCSRCTLFCPYGYITLKQGDLGFLVPYIEKCVGCGTCIKSCPFSDEFDEEQLE